MFFNREKEIGVIKDFLSSEDHAMLVYGRRRVGKTTLISRVMEDYEGQVIFYQCTSESYERNCQQFMREVEAVTGGFWGRPDTFYDVFRILKNLSTPVVVVIDEYNELKDSYGGMQTDSMMQKIIDSLKDSKIRIILSGSALTIMKEVLDSSNPLFGRFSSILKVEDFDYYEATSFIDGWSNRDKAAVYSVFGGSPAALECIDPSRSLAENIQSLLLANRGSVRNLVETTLVNEVSKIGPALTILSRLGNGKRTYGELKEVFDQKNTGNLSHWLSKLIEIELVSKSFPINDRDNARKAFYTIGDNLFRFYFTYVYPNRSRLDHVGPAQIYEALVKPSLDTYLSYRFEGIAREYFSRLAYSGRAEGLIDIGAYWYDDRKAHTNGEFDVALEFANGFEIYEAKFLKGKMSRELAIKEAEKIMAIGSFKARKIGFISIEGFDFCLR